MSRSDPFICSYNFLQRKLEEFDRLKQEIETLRQENHAHLKNRVYPTFPKGKRLILEDLYCSYCLHLIMC
jgi:hypothetical protein